jgi:hypothetical protein
MLVPLRMMRLLTIAIKTGECGWGEVDVKPEASQRHQCQRNVAEDKLRGQLPEIRGLVVHHSQGVPGLSDEQD